MSTTLARRLKDRGGAGGKIMTAKPSKSMTTPVSDKPLILDSAKKPTTDKEDRSRSISGGVGTRKPTSQSMPRIDKPAASDGGPRNRLSTSSLSRGRSSSPSDFTRILSDMRRNKVSSRDSGEQVPAHASSRFGSNGKGSGFRVSEKKCVKEPTPKVSEKDASSLRANRRLKENETLGPNSVKKSGKFEDVKELTWNSDKNETRVSDKFRKKDSLVSNPAKPTIASVNPALESCKNGSYVETKACVMSDVGCKGKLDASLKSNVGPVIEKNEKISSPKVVAGKNVTSLNSFDISSEKEVKGHSTCTGIVGKRYSSKLHEKLAFLEGKVKRIASDINRTKHMLDSSNPDDSKLIISDIQEKISGLEEAMSHVIGESDGKLCRPNSIGTDVVKAKLEHFNQNEQADGWKAMAKGLRNEELEARLFPHHKLLKDGTSSKLLASDSDGDMHAAPVLMRESSAADKLLSSVDEKPIEVEILSSLSKEQHKVAVGDVYLDPEVTEVQGTEDAGVSAAKQGSSNVIVGKHDADMDLTADESLDDFDDQENKPTQFLEEIEENSAYQLSQIGQKTTTGGWFLSEGESVLLTHDDGSCSFYDITNREEKAEYKPPSGFLPNIWRDCWITRAPSPDGFSGKYVVAASAGNASETGFCSWDFHTKEICAVHIEETTTSVRQVLGPLPNNPMHRRSAPAATMSSENQQWWYKPSGALIASTATCQKSVSLHDVRDGELIMKWNVQRPVLMTEYSSPLQWRNRGKMVIAEAGAISLWDVNSLRPQALLNISSSARQISALHVHNTDAEVGGGVRQRVSSSEAEGNDGVFCTADAINIMDFRDPSGIGLKIPKIGVSVQSIFSRGDSVYLGSTSVKSAAKKQVCSQIQQFSIRNQKLINTYILPETNAHPHYTSLTQVWGNSNFVMGVCGLGLFVFDASRDEVLPSFATDCSSPRKIREVIGPDDLYAPSFDYASSQILLISRDRPAMWRHL